MRKYTRGLKLEIEVIETKGHGPAFELIQDEDGINARDPMARILIPISQAHEAIAFLNSAMEDFTSGRVSSAYERDELYPSECDDGE